MNKHYRNSYITDEYDKFKYDEGNRDIDKKHVTQLVQSIQEHGYIGQPITVDNNMTIIDGQHRFLALRSLGMDVPYEVLNTNNDDACFITNSTSKNWTNDDYIKHWIAKGRKSYVYLKDIKDKWPTMPWQVIFTAFNKLRTNTLRDGTFECSRTDAVIAENAIAYAESYRPILQDALGTKKFVFHFPALVYCYREPLIDNDLLYRKMALHVSMIKPVANAHQCMEQIEAIYNFKARDASRLHIVAMYEDNRREIVHQSKGGKK